MIKKLYHFIDSKLENNAEQKCVLHFAQKVLDNNSSILDVGCGYGRNMKIIKTIIRGGGVCEGVDINKSIVEINRKNGLICYTADEFKNIKKKYDCIIFSHIIEHFTPNELKDFFEYYLSYLTDGGHVIIATPILWEGFYWDFDHIKMYHPIGIGMIFGNKDAQVQYYSTVKLNLVDIWFRKNPYMVHYKKGLYVKNFYSKFYMCINLLYKIIFKVSFGFLGKTTGWVALYKKII